MKKEDIQENLRYADTLGKVRLVKSVTSDFVVNYEVVSMGRGSNHKTMRVGDEGSCDLRTFSTWATRRVDS